MKYFVSIGDRTHEVVIDGGAVLVDGRQGQAHLERVPGTPLAHLILDGRSYTFAVVGGVLGKWTLVDRGEAAELEVLDERTRHIRSLVGGGKSHIASGPIKAPMPGLVVKLLVEPGQTVTAGQGLVVLEAMKMENELKAPGSGLVAEVSVRTGQAVEKGQSLVVLQSVDPA